MEERQLDLQGMVSRAGELSNDIRHSAAFPAILGVVAGGLAGALMAAIIAGRASTPHRVESKAPQSDEKKHSASGWTVGEAVQLITVLASLAKQAQDWYQTRQQERVRFS